MRKLNETIYNKLQLQAQEAKEQGLVKLANAVNEAIGIETSTEFVSYSYDQMNDDIHKDLWKIAQKLMIYYDVDSASIEKIDKSLISWAAIIVDDIEKTLEVSDVVKGPLENKLLGEK